MRQILPTILTILLMTLSVNAAPIFEEPFDYGDTTDDIRDVSNWDTGSGVIDYDHDGGLTHPGIVGLESGGSVWHNFADGNDRSLENTTDVSLDPFPGASAGDTFWIAALISASTSGESNTVIFDNGQNVNDWGFGINSSNDVVLRASDNGGNASTIDTGVDAVLDGTTYLFLSRATIGPGINDDKQSTIDFWFNPTNTSSEAALGPVTFSTGNDSKIGRSTGAYNRLSINFVSGARVDEIRFGETLTDVTGFIPEPTSAALLGLAAVALLRRRRGVN